MVTSMSAFFARIWEVTGSFSSIDMATKQLLMSYIQNNILNEIQAIYTTGQVNKLQTLYRDTSATLM